MQSFSADKVVYLLGESAPDCPCFYPASSAGTEMWVQARKIHNGTAGHWQGLRQEHTAKAHKWSSDLFHTHHLDGGGPGCRIRIHGAGAVDEKDVPPFPFTGLTTGTVVL